MILHPYVATKEFLNDATKHTKNDINNFETPIVSHSLLRHLTQLSMTTIERKRQFDRSVSVSG